MGRSKTYLWVLLALLTGSLGLASCGEDRWPAYYEYTGDNLWIDNVMRQHYLWEKEMPSKKDLTAKYFASPSAFLDAVRYKDDAFTTVDSLLTARPDYGLDYVLYRFENDGYGALVTYVEPGSPAGRAGMVRGTWIMEVDGKQISEEMQKTFLQDGRDHLLTMGRYQDGMIAGYAYLPLGPAETYPRADIPYYNILTAGEHRVGYLLCNRLGEDTEELQRIFGEFGSAGVTDAVLDLRYNREGTAEGMRQMASRLLPASARGGTLATLTYNNKVSKERPAVLTVDAEGGASLDLGRLYVLTSGATRGMAEHLINCLKPYMDVVVTGAATAGEYVVTETFDNEAWELSLRVATAEMQNAEGKGFTAGWTPDESVDADSDFAHLLPFGSAEETLLAAALDHLLH